jgi:NHLM bacteriocin system ABC transporter ATP-binding protein
MTEAARSPLYASRETLALDGRRVQHLNRTSLVLRVSAGVVDLFAQPRRGTRLDGARTHLFRLETGNLIFGLPSELGPEDATGEARRWIDIVAVGGQASEAVVLDPAEPVDMDLVETWLQQLCAALGRGGPPMEETRTVDGDGAGPGPMDLGPLEGGSAELFAGQRRAAPSRGVGWVRIDHGQIRVMDAAAPWTAADGPFPLAGGAWIEALGDAQVTIGGRADLSPEDIWPALDRFHALAVDLLGRGLARASQAAAARLSRRAELATEQTHRLFGALAGLIAPRASAAPDLSTGDPIFEACRLVGEAMGIAVLRPRSPAKGRSAFSQVSDIARSSRTRVRSVLLRADWWRRNAGPLVAWSGEDRRPVAVIPVSSRQCVVVDGATGARRTLDEAVASELFPEAATFYRPFPSGALSMGKMLAWSGSWTQGDLGRMMFAAIAIAIVAMTAPVITAVLVDSAIPRTDIGQVAFCAVALMTAAVAGAGLQAVQGVATLRMSGALDWTLQAAVMDRLLRLPIGFFKRYTAGDLAVRVLGVQAIRQVLSGAAIRGILSGAFCLFGFALMFVYDPPLAVVGGLLTLVHGGVILAVTVGRLRHERRLFDLQGKVQGLVLQLLTGVAKLRVAGATTRAMAIWTREFSDQKRHFLASQKAANALISFEAGFPTLASLVVFALAVPGPLSSRTLDAGQFLAFFAAFGATLAGVASLGATLGATLIAVPFFSRLAPVLREPLENPDRLESPGAISGAVDLSQVTFRYAEDGPPILDQLSIQVAKGEYLALVGPSGSGKSTIFRLLLGFEQPQSGTVMFDGRPLDTLDVAALRRQIGVVLQNGKLTSGSIYENICGASKVPVDQAWEAARNAGLDADIEAMPMGMYTMITEGMSTLSGGQRQRLMIARALVHRPPMLLFDEATSALDNHTQSVVSASLARLNVTRVVIAHRLSTVQDADRIIVLAGGRVVQSGGFAELSATPGLFADLAKRQLV